MIPKTPLCRTLLHEEGSSLVELALVSTVLMALLIGFMQVSIALYAYHYTAQAARMATRYAMVRGSTSCTNTPKLANCNATGTEITNYVQGLGFPGISSSSVGVTPTWCASNNTTPATWASCSSGSSNAPGNLVKVVVSYPLTFQIPFSKKMSLNLSSTSESVVSQ